MREAAAISAGELGRMMGVSRQLPLQFEKAEADDSITLRSLRTVADALDCDLVYALVPRSGSTLTMAATGERRRKNTRQTPDSTAFKTSAAEELKRENPEFEPESPGTYFCD